MELLMEEVLPPYGHFKQKQETFPLRRGLSCPQRHIEATASRAEKRKEIVANILEALAGVARRTVKVKMQGTR